MPTQPQRGHPAPNPPELMAASEAARRLCVSSQTVRDWYHAGTLKGVRIGHCIKVFADSVNALINPQTHKGI